MSSEVVINVAINKMQVHNDKQEQRANPTDKLCTLVLDIRQNVRHRRQQTVTIFLTHKLTLQHCIIHVW